MENPLTLKLFVDKKSAKIIFAEAEKDFVDFLFSMFTLPLGSVTQLITSQDMVGCVGRLYQSVESLSDKKNSILLQPKTLSYPSRSNPATSLRSYTQFYRRGYNHGSSNIGYVTDVEDKGCPLCGHSMSAAVAYVGTRAGSLALGGVGGCVKGKVKYMVTDDLVVTKQSANSIMSVIDLLRKFDVKDVNTIKKKKVEVGMKEGLALLKASLRSTTVLNDVFLVKQEH